MSEGERHVTVTKGLGKVKSKGKQKGMSERERDM
jgi:hypothetical protein